MKAARAWWPWLHRWIGLTAGLVLVLVGLTGSVIVFYRDLDAILHPAMYRPPAAETRVSLDSALAARARSIPRRSRRCTSPTTAGAPGCSITRTAMPTGRGIAGRPRSIPRPGQVLGRRDYTHGLIFTIYRLHYTLLLRPWWGEELVGVVGILIFLSALTGIYLWWSRAGRFVRSVTLKRGASAHRRWVDWHNMLGFYGAVALATVSFTGVAIIFPSVVRPIVGAATGSAITEALPSPGVPARAAPPLSADAMLARARAAVPWADVTSIGLPTPERNSWNYAVRAKGWDTMVRSRGAIWLDPYDGHVLLEHSGKTMTAGDRAMREMLWVHNGAVAGPAGRIAICALGLVPLILLVSGFAMWRKRTRARAVRQERRGAVLVAAEQSAASRY